MRNLYYPDSQQFFNYYVFQCYFQECEVIFFPTRNEKKKKERKKKHEHKTWYIYFDLIVVCDLYLDISSVNAITKTKICTFKIFYKTLIFKLFMYLKRNQLQLKIDLLDNKLLSLNLFHVNFL